MAKRPLKVRLAILGLVALLLLLQGRLWLSGDGWPEVARLRTSVATQKAANEQLTERNTRLKAEVNDLKDGFSALEERARSDLGMVGPEESFYLFIPAESDADSDDK